MFLESQSHLIRYINDFLYDFWNDFRTLQKAEIPIVDDEECIKLYSAYSGDKQICAGGQKGNQKSFKKILNIRNFNFIFIMFSKGVKFVMNKKSNLDPFSVFSSTKSWVQVCLAKGFF